MQLLDPLGYLEFLSLVAGSAGVLTDSGGIQEETTFLGIPCFTLRDNTERPVTVELGTNTLLGLDPARDPRDPPAARPFATGRAGVRAGLGRGGRWPNCRSPDRSRPVGFQVELTAMVNHTVEAASFAPLKRCL